jgi:heptosyltransferase-2
VISPNWVGDAVMSLPAITAIASAFTNAELEIIARPSVAGVFRRAGLRCQVHEVRNPRGWRIIAALSEAQSRLAEPNRDFIFVFPNSLYSALLANRIGARIRVGYAANARGFLLTHSIERPAKNETPPHESCY